MTSLLDNVNCIRETVITKYYSAASAELKDKVSKEPLQTNFNIYSGCVSQDIASEIARRFNSDGIVATVNTSGIISVAYYLSVAISLPSSLNHKILKEI